MFFFINLQRFKRYGTALIRLLLFQFIYKLQGTIILGKLENCILAKYRENNG